MLSAFEFFSCLQHSIYFTRLCGSDPILASSSLVASASPDFSMICCVGCAESSILEIGLAVGKMVICDHVGAGISNQNVELLNGCRIKIIGPKCGLKN